MVAAEVKRKEANQGWSVCLELERPFIWQSRIVGGARDCIRYPGEEISKSHDIQSS